MTYELTIEPLGQTIEVEEGQTLLDASLRAGVYLPHACGHGLCGTCKVQVLDGEIDHGPISSFALMDFEREEGLCLACCATAETDVTIEADIDDEPDALNLPVRSVTVELPEGAGHRPFSFAQAPSNPREVELDVRYLPGGVATTWIHQQLAVGDRLRLSGPYGRFHVRSSAQLPMLFLAGGSGLSSPRSMILDLIEHDCMLPITLVYGARNRDELYYADEFTELAARVPSFTYVPALSHEPDDSDWAGARGFAGDFRGHKAYLCGPPAMVDACITTLMQGRLFERDIYQELFISAADSSRVRSPLFKRI